MDTKHSANPNENRLHLLAYAIVAAIIILSATTLAATIPIIGLRPAPPPTTTQPSPTVSTAPAPQPENPVPPPAVANPVPPAPAQPSPTALAEPSKAFSNNWAGYAVTGTPGSVSDVVGSWVIPSVTCSLGQDSFSAFWTGIDGLNSRTVEQIGTDSDCVSGTAQYYAWYELYPHYPHDVSMVLTPGDKVSAEVKYTGNDMFTLSISDLTSGQSFQITSTASARRSSAEWIAEAPFGKSILPLADFSSVYFGYGSGGDYVTINGQTLPFGEVSPLRQIAMVDHTGNIIAQPSPLSSDGLSFSVQVA